MPSEKVWQQYLHEISQNKTIVDISFRDKTDGWKDYAMRIDYADGAQYRCHHLQDPYMKGFIKNLYLRPSCYQCPFKGNNYHSDITLGDLWNAQKMYREHYDAMGVSLILTRTKKGWTMMESIRQQLKTFEVDERVFEGFPSALQPAARPKESDVFDSMPGTFCQKVEKLTKVPVKKKAIRKLKRILKRVT